MTSNSYQYKKEYRKNHPEYARKEDNMTKERQRLRSLKKFIDNLQSNTSTSGDKGN